MKKRKQKITESFEVHSYKVTKDDSFTPNRNSLKRIPKSFFRFSDLADLEMLIDCAKFCSLFHYYQATFRESLNELLKRKERNMNVAFSTGKGLKKQFRCRRRKEERPYARSPEFLRKKCSM